jgi:hypothetical protein
VIYPSDAFDGFDTLFSAGPHHAREFQALGAENGLGPREVFTIGYGKLDALRAERPLREDAKEPRHILIAPSWGEANLIKEIGYDLIDALLGDGYHVTLRPHPSFFIQDEPEMAAIVRDYPGRAGFTLERSTGGSAALWTAEVLVSDYSGMALEFAALRRKPVVFADLPGKILNPGWARLGLPPAELALREKVGRVVSPNIEDIKSAISQLCVTGGGSLDFDAAIPLFLHDSANVGRKAAEAIAKIANRKMA